MAVCALCPWEPSDETEGSLTFPGGFTIPNYAVRFAGLGTLPLEVDTFSGDDTEFSTGFYDRERTGWTRTGTLTFDLSFLCDPTGELYEDVAEEPDAAAGWAANFALLDDLADATVTSGTQTVSYVAWPGATPVNLILKMKPPRVTDASRGAGAGVAMDFILYNPGVLSADATAPMGTGSADCAPLWSVEAEEAKGRVVFIDADYTIPNAAVRFIDDGASQLGVRSFVGEDMEAVGAVHPYPMVEKRRVAPLTLQLNFGVLPDGSPAPSAAEGAKRNIRLLNAVSALSLDEAESGVQVVGWEPNDGRPDYEMLAHVAPLTIGDVANGVGAKAGMVLTVNTPDENFAEAP